MYTFGQFTPLKDHAATIRRDLASFSIPIHTGPVPSFPEDEKRIGWYTSKILTVPVYGVLHGITFRRTEDSWLAHGPIPVDTAIQLCNDPSIRESLRVDDSIFCPPPNKDYFIIGLMACDGGGAQITVVENEEHLKALRVFYPNDHKKADAKENWNWYRFIPAGSHLKDGCVHSWGIYSHRALHLFTEAIKALHKES